MPAVAEYFSRYKISFTNEYEEEKIRLLTESDILGKQGKAVVGGSPVFGINPGKILLQSGISIAHFAGDAIGVGFQEKMLVAICYGK